MAGKGNQGKNVGKPGSPGWQATDKSKLAGKTPPASGPITEDTSPATEQAQENYEGLTELFIIVEPVKQTSVRPLPEVVQRYVHLKEARRLTQMRIENNEALMPAATWANQAEQLEGTLEIERETLQNIEENIVVNDFELLHYGLVRKS